LKFSAMLETDFTGPIIHQYELLSAKKRFSFFTGLVNGCF